MEQKKYLVTGIGTDVGKTVVSAIIAQALEADYWKPIQSGELDNSDSHKIDRLTNDFVQVLPERFRLTEPLSPHASAAIDGIQLQLSDFTLPETKRNLLVEGAGGLMVPINDTDLLIDAFKQWNLPVIIVSRHYVGSINHTLLTIEALKNRGITIKGLVFVGEENSATESFILNHSNVPFLMRIPIVSEVTTNFVQQQAELVKELNCL
ncbi:MAG: dethiobiotin synthase [Crocinitomicaceae bacterium]|nr:dethiobiotin synthase [Crocinitomicaceae bacterium]